MAQSYSTTLYYYLSGRRNSQRTCEGRCILIFFLVQVRALDVTQPHPLSMEDYEASDSELYVEDGYSGPIYYDYNSQQLVRADYTPYKLPRTTTSLHDGQSELQRPQEPRPEPKSVTTKFSKYLGTQLKDDLTPPTFQRFRAEWNAYLQVSNITAAQEKEQFVDYAIAGNAKLLVVIQYEQNLRTTPVEDIIKFLESKLTGHLGIRQKAAIVENVQQNLRESSLITLFINLQLAFKNRPTISAEEKILAAFKAFKSDALIENVAKRENEFKDDWNKFQTIANEEWGHIGTVNAVPDQVAKLQNQVNFLQAQMQQRDQVNAFR